MGHAHYKKGYGHYSRRGWRFSESHHTYPHASVVFDMVYIHTPHDIGEFKLFWELSSRNFSDSGELTVHVAPDFEYDYVENEKLAGTEKVFDLEETE